MSDAYTLQVDNDDCIYIGGAFTSFGNAISAATVSINELSTTLRSLSFVGAIGDGEPYMVAKTACPWCGNNSGLRDSRGFCISCGGKLE